MTRKDIPSGSQLTSFNMSANWDDVLQEPAGPPAILTSSQATRQGPILGRGKRKLSELGVAHDVENGERHQQSVVSPTQEEITHVQARFACPLFKGPINRSELNRACLGHGWTQLHRVTEHIQRCHIPEGFIKSLICNRCHEGFLSQDLLVQHQRQEDPCPIKNPQIAGGKVTLEQAAKLTAIKKKPKMSDEIRWFEFYDIIFPGQDPAHKPLTPYHESLTNPTPYNPSAPALVSISRYRDSFLEPCNPIKKRKLEGKLKCWGISDPRLCRTIAAKVQEYQVQDLQEFIEAGAGTLNMQVATESNPPEQDLDGYWEFDSSQFILPDLFSDWDV